MQPDAMPGDGVRKARRADVKTIARMLALAFDDDPLTTWMFPDPRTRHLRLPRMFQALLGEALPLDEVYTTESLRGAAIWNPPGTFPLGWQGNARMGWTMARLLRHRLVDRAEGLLYFDRHHPKEPHWYLQMLGTEPEWQGKGIASSLLSPILERCDQSGHRVYLEASKEKNIPFYARHGFVVTEEMQVPKGPTVWAMWRDPR
ncbi:MAG TPA: GNAT family N-acetyltransferase [Acidimicrobiales bacterium]|nr:GNAT family N-acetyltransferase [Acidimicrobiales bacterium]HLN43163.1 GNAT family N-acetyltransferase [Acidimicrobiales bacterium]